MDDWTFKEESGSLAEVVRVLKRLDVEVEGWGSSQVKEESWSGDKTCVSSAIPEVSVDGAGSRKPTYYLKCMA